MSTDAFIEKSKKFIEKAKKIHGDKYDYTKVNYIKAQTKVIIICKIIGHGEFNLTPNKHLSRCLHPATVKNPTGSTEFLWEAAKDFACSRQLN